MKHLLRSVVLTSFMLVPLLTSAQSSGTEDRVRAVITIRYSGPSELSSTELLRVMVPQWMPAQLTP